MLGIVLALALLLLLAAAIIAIWRVPFRAFPILVAGMAFHNFLLMILLQQHVPGVVVRTLQLWKEGILLLLAALLLYRAWQSWRRHQRPRLLPLDWLAAAFTLLLLAYLIVPASLLHGPAGYTRRLVEFRQLFLIPMLYTCGRVFRPRDRGDLSFSLRLLLGAAGVVGAFGLVELWLVPTTSWLSWGVTALSDWLHYAYNGPHHVPDYFFQSTPQFLLLRRMVSTYVSPLGIAYTGLLLVPLAASVFFARRTGLPQWFRGATFALLIAAILLSVTRLAIGLMVAEMVLLLLLLRRRWLLVAVPVVGLLSLVVLFEYVNFGPLLDADLQPVSARPASLTVVPLRGSASDPSVRGHLSTLRTDLAYAIHHPIGTGLGSSIHQFGSSGGRGESAIFDILDDAGLLTGAVYLSLYALAIWYGFRNWRAVSGDPLLSAFPLTAFVGGLALAPITLTSEVYGDFSVTFLFWWAAGLTLAIPAFAASLREPGAGSSNETIARA